MLLRGRLIQLKPQPIASEAAKASRRSSAVRFCSGSAEPSSEKMEKAQEQPKPPPTTGDIMTDSFGHEYATRSDEEGFGGIYGSNQSLKKEGDDDNNPTTSEQGGSHGREMKQKESKKDS